MNALKLANKEPHALKIEDLNITEAYADEILAELKDFALDLGFSKDRLEALECRSRDGFIPYSHNKGGIEASAYMNQDSAYSNGTGFDNSDATLEKYHQYMIEYFLEDKKMTKEEFDKKMYEDRDREFQEEFDEYIRNDDDTVLFSLQAVLNSETELTVYLDVCVKDSPYHRQFDDRITLNIDFKSIKGIKQKLERVKKRDDVKCFSRNLMEAY